MNYNRYLTVEIFHNNYKTEIDKLYTTALNNLERRGVRIHNRHEFYNDFVHYVYKYSYKYE